MSRRYPRMNRSRPTYKPLELSPAVRAHLEAVPGGGELEGRTFRVRDYEKWTLPQRIAFLRLYVEDVSRDPMLARKTVEIFREAGVEPRQWERQWGALLSWVQKNIFYTHEPRERFQSPQHTLTTGGPADCLPADTLLRVKGRGDVPIRDVQVGDEIWGKDDWTRVEAVVEKGFLPVTRVTVMQVGGGRKSVETRVFPLIGYMPKTFWATRDHKVYRLSQGADGLYEERVPVSDLELGDYLIGPEGSAHEVIQRAPYDAYPRCYDIQTSDHYVYLPAAGVTVSNCDDLSILLASLAHSIRLPFRFVISGHDKKTGEKVRWIEGVGPLPENVEWSHIYVAGGWPPFKPKRWTFADPSLDKPLGWDAVDQAGDAKSKRGVELPEMSGEEAGLGDASPAPVALDVGVGARVHAFVKAIPWPSVAATVIGGIITFHATKRMRR